MHQLRVFRLNNKPSTSCQWFLCFGTRPRHQTRAPWLGPPRLKKAKSKFFANRNILHTLKKEPLNIVCVSADLRASQFVLYLFSTSCVLTLAYSTLFPLGDTLLLLSSCRREGVHSELPGLRGLLGVRLPVDVPVAPCSAFDESYRICFTLPHTLYKTFCHYCNK